MNEAFDFSTVLAQVDTVVQRQPGDVIIDMDQPGSCMFIVASGSVLIQVGDIVLETVGKGGLVGEVAMLDDNPRIATVIAGPECGVAVIDRERCLALVRENPQFAIELLRVIARRLRATNFFAHHDPVTRLPNRASLEQHLRIVLKGARRHNRPLAVMVLDMEGFRSINDLLGHAAGDEVVEAAGARLSAAVRDADFVARMGVDQFAIVLEDIGEIQNAVSLAQKLVAEMSKPFVVDGQEIALSASVGISCHPQDANDERALLRSANAAASRARELGTSYQFFSPELNVRALEALAITNKLRLALEREEFTLHFQPRVDLRSGEVTGAEALIRWQDPDLGMIPPATFIPLAEKRGMIGAIGAWVLEAACRQSREWQNAGMRPLRLAINLSLVQLREADLARTIGDTLRALGLNAEHLELEITETCAMDDAEMTVNALTTLSDMGLALAIDDFGTGYSSLSYLKRFPVNYLKIDQSFVRGIPSDQDDMTIVRTIIAMAKNLGMRTIAEGVETPEQLAFLRQEGCDEAQGFLFGTPMPAEELVEFLREGNVMRFFAAARD
jgi:diguanylate cyclase (GGDEF)-like protein